MKNKFTNKWALITGASSGIGQAIAEELARQGCSLLLLARREEKLHQHSEYLKARFDSDIHIYKCDLNQIEQVDHVLKDISSKNISIDFLVNNAGCGVYGRFVQNDPKKLENMLDLNVKALTVLCNRVLPEMLKRGSGQILNVASLASFQAMTNFAAYAATKAYVLHFSEALDEELVRSGVRVQCLCPGPVKTEFFNEAGMTDMQWGPRKRFFQTSQKVAEEAVKCLKNNKRIHLTRSFYKLLVFWQRFLPRSWVVKLSS